MEFRHPRNGILRTAAILAIAIPIAGCSLFPWQSSRFGGEASEVFFLDLGRDDSREINYTLRLGDDVADVYFAFVNYGDSSTLAPVVTPLSAEAILGAQTLSDRGPQDRSAAGPSDAAPGHGIGEPRRVEPAEIAGFNNNPPEFMPGSPATSRAPGGGSRFTPRAGETEGAEADFYQYYLEFVSSSAVLTPTTLQKVVDDGLGNVLNIWVANDEWSISMPDSTDLITQEKIDALADAFLLAGADNDIHDWVTTMLGEPWGDHGYTNLLSPADFGNTIDILLLDILLDGHTDSGVVGFFWGKDNYYRTSGTSQNTDESNERVMFYLDAVMYGQRDETNTWSVDQYWPQLVVSTLAHEFQHMIHFYQKNVLRSGLDSQRWLNEMMSMVVEDLVSYQMEIPGPRGVDPVAFPRGTAGASGNLDGWLGYFNANNDVGIYRWDMDDPEPNYAVNYGLGAFLARNYGGAGFAGAVVQNQFVDERALEFAFDALGHRLTFREALSEWAAAVLTSDEVIVPWEEGELEAVYNAGQWFESIAGPTTYRLGSINLFNHSSDDGGQSLSGPTIYSGDTIGDGGSRDAASVVYYQAGASLTGSLEWEIVLGANTDLVVVAKAVQ